MALIEPITLDPTTLSYEAAIEYRHEIFHAIRHPGIEWDILDPAASQVEHQYRVQLGKVDAHLATFGLGDPAIGAEARYE